MILSCKAVTAVHSTNARRNLLGRDSENKVPRNCQRFVEWDKTGKKCWPCSKSIMPISKTHFSRLCRFLLPRFHPVDLFGYILLKGSFCLQLRPSMIVEFMQTLLELHYTHTVTFAEMTRWEARIYYKKWSILGGIQLRIGDCAAGKGAWDDFKVPRAFNKVEDPILKYSLDTL